MRYFSGSLPLVRQPGCRQVRHGQSFSVPTVFSALLMGVSVHRVLGKTNKPGQRTSR